MTFLAVTQFFNTDEDSRKKAGAKKKDILALKLNKYEVEAISSKDPSYKFRSNINQQDNQKNMSAIQLYSRFQGVYTQMQAKEDSKKAKNNNLDRNYKIENSPIKGDRGNNLGFGMLDFSLFSPIIKTVRKSFQFDSPQCDLAMINTPMGLKRQKSFIEEVDQSSHHQISMVLGFKHSQQNDEYISESNSISEEESEEVLVSSSIQAEEVDAKDANIPQANQLEQILENTNRKQEQKLAFLEKTKKKKPRHESPPRRFTCNCKKTKCLKLYCDCFRENQFCDSTCNCTGCHNTEDYEGERNIVILSLLDRNPQAFKPKLEAQQHAKGCNCKKSGCTKKYCECYQAGMKCGQHCRCEQCKNIDQKCEPIEDSKKNKQLIAQ